MSLKLLDYIYGWWLFLQPRVDIYYAMGNNNKYQWHANTQD